VYARCACEVEAFLPTRLAILSREPRGKEMNGEGPPVEIAHCTSGRIGFCRCKRGSVNSETQSTDWRLPAWLRRAVACDPSRRSFVESSSADAMRLIHLLKHYLVICDVGWTVLAVVIVSVSVGTSARAEAPKPKEASNPFSPTTLLMPA
jgi:hypothetical protein